MAMSVIDVEQTGTLNESVQLATVRCVKSLLIPSEHIKIGIYFLGHNGVSFILIYVVSAV